MSKKKAVKNTKVSKKPKVTTSVSKTKAPNRTLPLVVTVLLLALVGFALMGSVRSQNEPTCQLEDNTEDCGVTTTSNENDETPETPEKPKKTTLSELFDIACRQTKLARCVLDDLEFDDARRTIRARREIPRHGLLIGLPYDLAITALDALRDPRIRKIFDARPDMASVPGYEPLSSGAYLSLHLVLERRRFRESGGLDDTPKEKVLRAWFQYLPTLEDFLEFHPVAKKVLDWTDEDKEGLGWRSYTPFVDQNVENIAITMMYEYKAFLEVSDDFEELVSFEEYVWAKLIIDTRLFHHDLGEEDIDDEEMSKILPHLHNDAIDAALRPLNDAINDHNQQNLGWMDNWRGQDMSEDRSMVIYAYDKIPKGQELFLSYVEQKPDYYKLSQYGFINTDGSENSMVAISAYHRPLFLIPDDQEEAYEESMKNKMFRYLNYMDGYEDCPIPDVEEEGGVPRKEGQEDVPVLFQYARMKALKKIFKKVAFWGMLMPNDMTGEITAVTDTVMTTCRILAMTHRNYEGQAMALLGKLSLDSQHEGNAIIPDGNEGFEYRTYHVLERLATESTKGILETLAPLASKEASDVETDLWTQLDSDKLDSTSLKGMRAYVMLRELGSLRRIIAFAQKKKDFYLESKQKKLDNGEEVNEEDYIVRMEHCEKPPEVTLTKPVTQ